MHSYKSVYYSNFKKHFTDYYNYFITSYEKNINKIKSTHKKLKFKNNLTKRKKTLKQNGGEIYDEDKYKFDFKIDEDEIETRIFIGNRHTCFIGSIFKDASNKLIIQGFNFHKECNIDKNMKTGKDTKIMFNTIIDYIKAKYKNISRIELTDKAELKCYSNILDIELNIDLYYLYHLKYGKGYYLQNFGFKIDNKANDVNIQKRNILKYLNFELYFKEFNKFIIDECERKYHIQLIKELERFFTLDNSNKKNEKINYKIISQKLKTGRFDCYFIDLLITFIRIKAGLIDLKLPSYYLNI
jgi:hypothetical protein